MNGVLNTLGPLILLAAFAGIVVWTIRACAADARRRGKSPLLVTLLILISFPLGFIMWLLVRR